jgi:hypothetical protein
MDLIYPFVKMRDILKNVPKEHQVDPIYQQIEKTLDDYIETHCQHHVVQDMIDISPEYSKTIYYCEHCWKTFDNLLQKP